ncbi:hypothetical protein C8R44DRAFT_873596 [Mycena epipterygia]|nr:hypothetical protein C8R44DRAFT_873596 [Mycena epipterygia]
MASTFPSDFIEARTLFEKLASNAKLLKEYEAPAQKRIAQLQEVGQTAFKFLGFPTQLLTPECKDLIELFFDMRAFYHELHHPVKDSRPSYPPDYDGLRQLTHQIQEDRKKKAAASKKVPKSKAIVDSDDDIEIITGNDGFNSNEVDASDKMQVDDEERPIPDIGTVPKGLRFKKLKVDHECAHEDHPEASCPSAQGPSTKTSKGKKNEKKRKFREDDDSTFIAAVLKELGYGSNISQVVEEAKLITAMPSDLPNTIPAIKKRLYQYMVEIAVINDRIRSDITLRSSHVEDAAALATRLSELENAAADE